MLLAKGAPTVCQEILAKRPMQVLNVPEIDTLMETSEEVQRYPWKGSFDEMKEKTFMILHTSGSTGIPKPVYVAHGTLASNDAHQRIPSLGGGPTLIDFFKGKRFFVAFPPFHAANLYFTIGYQIFSGMTCVLPPPGPTTADIVNMIHVHGNLDGSVLPPSTIVDIYNTSEYYFNMTQRLQFVAYVGGTLAKEVGDPISTKMKLITLMGASELGYLPVEIADKSTAWQHIPISPHLGHEYRPSRDGFSELVIVRNPKHEIFQGVFSIFTTLDEYATNDLYEPDPSAPATSKSWIFRARSDDIIALSNAEKLNPVTMEALIASHPAVNAALIGGHGEFQAALLIEPKVEIYSQQEEAKLRQAIWPTVMEANRSCPAHGRIMKDHILVTSPGKPLPQAAKGTVQRYAALKLYSQEFKAFYSLSKGRSGHQAVPSIDKSTSANGAASTSSGLEEMKPATQNPSFSSYLADSPELASAIDTHIEKALNRLLPDILLQHLGPAFARMITDLLHPVAARHNVTSQVSEVKLNGVGQTGYTTPSTSTSDGTDKANSYDKHDRKATYSHEDTATISSSRQDLQSSLRQAIENSTYMHGLNDEANFFDCGLDSLQIGALVKEINEFLPKLVPDVEMVSIKTIYENPTCEALFEALQGFLVSAGNTKLHQ